MNKTELVEELRRLRHMMDIFFGTNDASEMAALWTEITSKVDQLIERLDAEP